LDPLVQAVQKLLESDSSPFIPHEQTAALKEALGKIRPPKVLPEPTFHDANVELQQLHKQRKNKGTRLAAIKTEVIDTQDKIDKLLTEHDELVSSYAELDLKIKQAVAKQEKVLGLAPPPKSPSPSPASVPDVSKLSPDAQLKLREFAQELLSQEESQEATCAMDEDRYSPLPSGHATPCPGAKRGAASSSGSESGDEHREYPAEWDVYRRSSKSQKKAISDRTELAYGKSDV
jgi:hypothetical protein